MHINKAQSIALKILNTLAPLCHRIEIAGSIRRGLPEVNDIDLVVQPKDLAIIKQRCLERSVLVLDGECNFIFRLPNLVQVDIFFARGPIPDMFNPLPTNWGTILLMRTGSKDHNIWLCQRARRQGVKWDPYKGVIDADGYVLASETERQIYECLGLQYLLPDQRELPWIQRHLPDTIKRKPAPPSNINPKSDSEGPMAETSHPSQPNRDPAAAAQALEEFRRAKAQIFNENAHSEI